MLWKKIKHIEIPHIENTWMHSHFANPHVIILNNSLWRVYCNTRDSQNRAFIVYVDLDPANNFSIVGSSPTPLLDLGPDGAFDDNGASLGCIFSTDDTDYLFYLGWNLGVNVPFRNSIGLAKSEKGKNQFKKLSIGPIMDRDMIDPFSLSYPFIIKNDNKYKMWYGSHKRWGRCTEDMLHGIKYAESEDLIHWSKKNIVCIDANEENYAFSKPYVCFENNKYKMWYSYRGDKYRIGYAESEDGFNWTRLDQMVGINTSATGWDSEMIEYPFILDFQGNRYMLYNGNSYGKTGMGIAILEESEILETQHA